MATTVLLDLLLPDLPDGSIRGLGGGAWRTIRAHVERFEAMEAWFSVKEESPFPVTLVRVIKYLDYDLDFAKPQS